MEKIGHNSFSKKLPCIFWTRVLYGILWPQQLRLSFCGETHWTRQQQIQKQCSVCKRFSKHLAGKRPTKSRHVDRSVILPVTSAVASAKAYMPRIIRMYFLCHTNPNSFLLIPGPVWHIPIRRQHTQREERAGVVGLHTAREWHAKRGGTECSMQMWV